MENDKVKLSSFLFGLIAGLLVGAVVLAGLALSGALSPKVVSVPGSSDQQFLGATGVANRLPHGYWDTGFGYYVNGVQVIDGSSNGTFVNVAASGPASFSGPLVQGGVIDAISTSSATYTLTANDVCGSAEIQFTPLGAITTVTVPATSTLFAAGTCLGSVGEFKDLVYNSVSTSTVLAVGAGGTLNYSSSSTIANAKTANLRVLRDGTNTYRLLLVNTPN